MDVACGVASLTGAGSACGATIGVAGDGVEAGEGAAGAKKSNSSVASADAVLAARLRARPVPSPDPGAVVDFNGLIIVSPLDWKSLGAIQDIYSANLSFYAVLRERSALGTNQAGTQE